LAGTKMRPQRAEFGAATWGGLPMAAPAARSRRPKL